MKKLGADKEARVLIARYDDAWISLDWSTLRFLEVKSDPHFVLGTG
jgi:hypothetical protein